jgi:hypothetical protein
MGVKRGTILPHTVGTAPDEFVIWGNTTKLSKFFTGITTAAITAPTVKTIQMPAMTVKRYPGDTGFTRKAHPRKVLSNTGVKGGTTPGKVFMCEEKVLDAGSGEIEYDVTQFTTTGTTLQLRQFAKAKAKVPFRLRWNSGRTEEIVAAGGATRADGSESGGAPVHS